MYKAALISMMLMSSAAYANPVKVWTDRVSSPPFKTEHIKVQSVENITALDERFGGLSALMVNNGVFTSVTDKGHLVQFINKKFTRVTIKPLLNQNGRPLSGKKKTDAESLALAPGGTFYIAFERNHRIQKFDQSGRPVGEPVQLPKAIQALSDNGGLEAIETLQDGRLIILAEGKKGEDQTSLWVQNANDWQHVSFSLSDEFRPTGLTRLPDSNDLVLLERFYTPFSGVRLRLSMLDGETGLRGALLAELGPPTAVDNYEGITAYKDKSGSTILMLISDDNFNPLQRTLLMKIKLH